jgi:hypothetical protein
VNANQNDSAFGTIYINQYLIEFYNSHFKGVQYTPLGQTAGGKFTLVRCYFSSAPSDMLTYSLITLVSSQLGNDPTMAICYLNTGICRAVLPCATKPALTVRATIPDRTEPATEDGSVYAFTGEVVVTRYSIARFSWFLVSVIQTI